MQKEPNKPNVLFVASNIPTPKRQSNKVVMTIAHKLSPQFSMSVLHPAEFAPFPFNMMKKYKNIMGSQSWEDDGIVVRPFKYIRLFGKKNAFLLLPCYKKRILRYCQQHGIPQLVHAHFALPDGYIAYQISKLFGVPYIISFRKSDIVSLNLPHCSTKKLMSDVLSNASKIIVHNAAQQEILSKAGYESVVMPHGIENDFFAKKESANTSNILNIACVGELIPQKHIDWVINAVRDYEGDKKLKLKVAGEGPMRHELELLAQGADDIQLLGKISHDNVGELLRRSDIFALPSVNETFGLVYLEATAHQNAVIATKGTGIWGNLTDGDEALYCDSYTSFQEKLYKLIEEDGFRNQMAINAYVKTKENYTWDIIIGRYVSLYRSLMVTTNCFSS